MEAGVSFKIWEPQDTVRRLIKPVARATRRRPWRGSTHLPQSVAQPPMVLYSNSSPRTNQYQRLRKGNRTKTRKIPPATEDTEQLGQASAMFDGSVVAPAKPKTKPSISMHKRRQRASKNSTTSNECSN
jgi:hypothetical protein